MIAKIKIMRKKILQISVALLVLTLVQSCTKDLELKPTNDVTSETVYATPAGYKQVLAKVYGSFALTGNAISTFCPITI